VPRLRIRDKVTALLAAGGVHRIFDLAQRAAIRIAGKRACVRRIGGEDPGDVSREPPDARSIHHDKQARSV
jgi:hypothetical protein